MSENDTDELLTVEEAAILLRQHRVTVYRRIASGELKALRIGAAGPLRVRADAVEQLLRPARQVRA